MNPLLGWALAALAVALAWQQYGLKGLALGVTLVIFWLVLQFNRAVRVMKNAANSPVGHVDSAVMLNAKLRAGMQMLQVVTLTRSIGRQADGQPDVFSWSDAGGVQVHVSFLAGRCQSWTLVRPEAPGETAVAE